MNENLLKLLDGYAARYPHALEDKFPRVLNKIIELWGMPAMDAYFDELMLDNQGVARQGFPPEVASEIFALSVAYANWHRETTNAKVGSADVCVWGNVPVGKRHEVELKGLEFTPAGLEKAVEAGNEEAVRLYLACGAEVDARDERDWTPLMISSFNGNEHLAMLLIQYGAKVHAQDKNGYTPLHWAAFQGYDKVVDLLIDKGANVNAFSQYGWTPLMQAATRGQLVVVAKLLAAGAYVNATSHDGWTALHKASSNGHGHVVKLLLSKGADPAIQHPSGSTAISLARKYRHNDVANMLNSYYAHPKAGSGAARVRMHA